MKCNVKKKQIQRLLRILGLVLLYVGVGCKEPPVDVLAPLEVRVQVADERHLMITIDPSELENQRILDKLRATDLDHMPMWKQDMMVTFKGLEVCKEVRPQFNFKTFYLSGGPASDPYDQMELDVQDGGGTWISAVGRKRVFDPAQTPEKVYRLQVAEVQYTYFVTLPQVLASGAYVLTLPTGQEVPFSYDAQTSISPLYKYDQVGYLPDAKVKLLALGAWMGTGGAFPLLTYDHARFDIVDEALGQSVYNGQLEYQPDLQTKTGMPLTGEQTLLADFSLVMQPGTYHCVVKGIGRSPSFTIREEALADAVATHVRGLSSRRCGKTCHKRLLMGSFPPKEGDYVAPKELSGAALEHGFFTTEGMRFAVKPFTLIHYEKAQCKQMVTASGGWHDAADYDRRSYHLAIVKELCFTYLFNSEAFTDGQFNLAESGDGLPDILDEAMWGLEIWRQLQQPNGSVPGWIETVRHPTEPCDPETDNLKYYTSLATRESTLAYAAQAATLAYTLSIAGHREEAARYQSSALSAWAFAKNPANRVTHTYHLEQNEDLPTDFVYRESPNLPEALWVEAALALSLMSGGNEAFFADLPEDYFKKAQQTFHTFERNSPFRFASLFFLDNVNHSSVAALRKTWCQTIDDAAKIILHRMVSNPYHTPWRSPTESWYASMGWGNGLPLNTARVLALAWRMTGRQAYYEAALQAVNFHNGLNPLGLSYTTGLGSRFPVRYLELSSNKHAEYPPGITPYRNVGAVPLEMASMVMGLYCGRRLDCGFMGCALNLYPETTDNFKNEYDFRKFLSTVWPVERRFCNVECYTVASSEFTIWETIAPAISATGLLLPATAPKAQPSVLEYKRAADLKTLPGYWVMP